MDAQLKKGILELCILQYLENGDMYGYPIMTEMKQYFPDVNDSTFYAILRRLHQEKMTEVYTGTEASGPPRKYYRLTIQGKNRLRQGKLEWHMICDILEQIGV